MEPVMAPVELVHRAQAPNLALGYPVCVRELVCEIVHGCRVHDIQLQRGESRALFQEMFDCRDKR